MCFNKQQQASLWLFYEQYCSILYYFWKFIDVKFFDIAVKYLQILFFKVLINSSNKIDYLYLNVLTCLVYSGIFCKFLKCLNPSFISFVLQRNSSYIFSKNINNKQLKKTKNKNEFLWYICLWIICQKDQHPKFYQ